MNQPIHFGGNNHGHNGRLPTRAELNSFLARLLNSSFFTHYIFFTFPPHEHENLEEAISSAAMYFYRRALRGGISVFLNFMPAMLDDEEVILDSRWQIQREATRSVVRRRGTKREQINKMEHFDESLCSFTERKTIVDSLEVGEFLEFCKVRLDPDDFKLLQMIYMGSSYQEVGKHLGVSQNTIRNRHQQIQIELEAVLERFMNWKPAPKKQRKRKQQNSQNPTIIEGGSKT